MMGEKKEVFKTTLLTNPNDYPGRGGREVRKGKKVKTVGIMFFCLASSASGTVFILLLCYTKSSMINWFSRIFSDRYFGFFSVLIHKGKASFLYLLAIEYT